MNHIFPNVGIAGTGHTPLEGDGFRLVSNLEFIQRLTAPAHSELFGTYQPTREQMESMALKWRNERPGIETRVVTSLTTLDMAVIAASMALVRARITPDQLSAIIFTSNTSDRGYPKSSCGLIEILGASTNCFGIDTGGSCADGGLALLLGASLISAARPYVLVVASERATRIVERGDYRGGNLFGDAAGAVLLQHNKTKTLRFFTEDDPFDGKWGLIRQDFKFQYDGHYTPAWGSSDEGRIGPFRQNGKEVHKWACTKVAEAAVTFIQGLPVELALVIPHQASTTTLDLFGQKLVKQLPELDGKIFRNVFWRGNTSSASTLVGLSEAICDGTLQKTDFFTLLTFGAGLQKAFVFGQV